MQVYHERYCITANGFFDIDLNLLGSVLRILNIDLHCALKKYKNSLIFATFLLILIQFEESYRELQLISKPLSPSVANATTY